MSMDYNSMEEGRYIERMDLRLGVSFINMKCRNNYIMIGITDDLSVLLCPKSFEWYAIR